jgi:hypothetical protein
VSLELLLFVAAAIVAGVAALMDGASYHPRLVALAVGLMAAGLAVAAA